MKRVLYAGVVLLSAGFLLAGCGGKEETDIKSIGEIHEEEGIPVTVRSVEHSPFTTHLSYISSLRGAAESTASSMVSDEVEEILLEVGDYVKRNTTVVLFPEDNPAINFEQAKVSFESARTAYNRIERLYEDEGVSQQSYDDARTQYELARANWESVRKMTRIAAPISGYITRINVFESENVQPGVPLFTVSDYSKLKTIVWVSDRDIPELEVGQRARAAWQDELLEGRVVQVDMAMDDQKKAFAVKLEFDNDELSVQSGITAEIEIETFREDESLIVHQREVVTIDDEHYIFLAENGEARRRSITVEREEGLYRQVSSGIRPGDRVITEGIELLKDGDLIEVVEEAPRLLQS